jgi:hypothetical protein
MEAWDRTRPGSNLSVMESIQRIKHTVFTPIKPSGALTQSDALPRRS